MRTIKSTRPYGCYARWLNSIPDQVTDILLPLVDKGDKWPEHILNTICWNESDDSERMFELRLLLAKKGYVKDFVDWPSLCAKYPLRAIRLIEAVVSSWQVDEGNEISHKKNRFETWYDQDLDALLDAVKNYPNQTWDLLMPQVERLAGFQTSLIESRWREQHFPSHETDIARGMVEMLFLSGQTLASEQPHELLKRTTTLNNGISPVIQEIIISILCLSSIKFRIYRNRMAIS